MATIYGFFYLLFTTFPTVFEGQYGFSSSSSGLVYLGTGVGSMVGLFATGVISDKLVMALAKRNEGNPKPEYRLPVMFLGGLLVPIGLFLVWLECRGTGTLDGSHRQHRVCWCRCGADICEFMPGTKPIQRQMG